MIVGRSAGIKHNDFFNTTRTFGDFELRLSFHLVGGKGNSGIQFRSKKIPGHVSGYQADIGEKYWGCLYDEARRNKVLVQAPAELDKVLKKEGWNDYVIRAQGDHIQLWVNGLRTVITAKPTLRSSAMESFRCSSIREAHSRSSSRIYGSRN